MLTIEITDEAINKLLEKRSAEKFEYIKLGVAGGGCAGLEYIFDSASSISGDDLVVDYGKIKFAVDPQSAPYISGMTIDWVKEGLNEFFKFNNPKEESSCGCGVSINFDMNAVNNYENLISKG